MTIGSHNVLAGLRVLDASRVLAGPYCGQVLGDLGAEVIKIERPGSGDETRGWGPPFLGELSAYYLSCNRNKQGMTLNLAHPEGARLFQDLAKKADVVLENFRLESSEKLGISADKLLAANPRLVVCSISGFGRTGPLKDLPGYDFAIQALSGFMSITGPVDGPPSKVGVAVTDVLTGLYAAVAILACLQARHQSDHGYTIDLALLDCALAAQVNVAQAFLTQKKVPARQGNAHLQIVPYQLFQTHDGWIVLAVGNDNQWQAFCRAAKADDLLADPRFLTNAGRVNHREVLVPCVEEIMSRQTTQEWQKSLQNAGVPHAPVWDYHDLFAHPQSEERGWKLTVKDPQGRPVDLVGSPFHISSTEPHPPLCPPQLGEHTSTILKNWLGMNAEQISVLRQKGAM